MDLYPQSRAVARTETPTEWVAKIVAANAGKETTTWPVRARVPQHLITVIGAAIVFIDSDGTYKAKGAK